MLHVPRPAADLLPVAAAHREGSDPWFPGSVGSGAASCCLGSLATGAASLDWAQPALEELLGSVQ